jgi:acetyl esterase
MSEQVNDQEPVPNAAVVAYLDSLAPEPSVWERDFAEWRQGFLQESLAGSGQREPVAAIEDFRIGNVPVRMYRPAGGEVNALVWLHGGAWIIGDLDCYDAAVRAIANRANCAVLAADYRLAPEHPYPAGLDDCWAVTHWASTQFKCVSVGGDSSGGNLAAATALRARDEGVSLALQLLVYPVLDYRVESVAYSEFTQRYAKFAGVTGYGAEFQKGLRYIWEVYIPDRARRLEQAASPLRARSLVNVAPAFIITAEHDILRGEANDFAQRLHAEGVPVEVVNYEGQIHRFFHLLGAFEDDATDAVERSARALKEAFGRMAAS